MFVSLLLLSKTSFETCPFLFDSLTDIIFILIDTEYNLARQEYSDMSFRNQAARENKVNSQLQNGKGKRLPELKEEVKIN